MTCTEGTDLKSLHFKELIASYSRSDPAGYVLLLSFFSAFSSVITLLHSKKKKKEDMGVYL